MQRRYGKWKKAPQARNKKEKCATKFCRNRRAKKSNGCYMSHCWKCRTRMQKITQPESYSLKILRQNAKMRKIPFTLTLEEFKKFCKETDYIERRGKKPGCLTVDRIDWNKGYHIWNIRVLEFMENSAQGADANQITRAERGAETTDDPF